MNNIRKSDTETIIGALRILAVDIKSDDGVSNACIFEAADRLEELHAKLDRAIAGIKQAADKAVSQPERSDKVHRILLETLKELGE